MTPEQKMNALFAAEAAPARDVGFEVAVLARIARHRAWASVLALLPGCSPRPPVFGACSGRSVRRRISWQWYSCRWR